MVEHQVPQRVFGITQAVLLVAIVAAMVLHWRRMRARRRPTALRLDNIDLRSVIRRTPLAPAASRRAEGSRVQAAPRAQSPPPSPARLESAFPAWDKHTPPHEILEVAPDADRATVEAAYKKLLKRYHPDRFASWGKGYQKRAHHVVLLLQSARDRLLRKPNS